MPAWAGRAKYARSMKAKWSGWPWPRRSEAAGRALMLTAMTALRQAGVELISLGADSYADQPTIGLWPQLGFSLRKAVIDYRGVITH